MVKAVFTKKNTLFTSKLDVNETNIKQTTNQRIILTQQE